MPETDYWTRCNKQDIFCLKIHSFFKKCVEAHACVLLRMGWKSHFSTPALGARAVLPGHLSSPAWTSKLRHRFQISTSSCYWMSTSRCSCETIVAGLEKEALRRENKSVVPSQTQVLHHCGILPTCGFQPFSHCTSLKMWLHKSCLSVNLIFLICFCKSLWKFLWIPWDSMDCGLNITVQHPSSASDVTTINL